MQSLASLMSLKESDIGNLDDFNDSDEEGAEDRKASVGVGHAIPVTGKDLNAYASTSYFTRTLYVLSTNTITNPQQEHIKRSYHAYILPWYSDTCELAKTKDGFVF